MELKKGRLTYFLVVLALMINLIISSSCLQSQGVTKEQYETLQNDLTATKAELTTYKAKLAEIKETWKTLSPKLQIADTMLENSALWGRINAGQTTTAENSVKFGNEWASMSVALTQLDDADLKTAMEKWWFKNSDTVKWNQDKSAFYELFRQKVSDDFQKLNNLLQD